MTQRVDTDLPCCVVCKYTYIVSLIKQSYHGKGADWYWRLWRQALNLALISIIRHFKVDHSFPHYWAVMTKGIFIGGDKLFDGTLEMEAMRSYWTLVTTYETTRRHITEDTNAHFHRRDNLKYILRSLSEEDFLTFVQELMRMDTPTNITTPRSLLAFALLREKCRTLGLPPRICKTEVISTRFIIADYRHNKR